MSRYLTKYVGKYRVKAMYDLSTNDFPRLENGNIDPSFEDIYIPCKANCMIRHAYYDNLSAYIPSLKRGHNLIKQITDKYGKDIIYDIDETDAEVVFHFKAVNIEKIAEFMLPLTSGCSISPFSKKNLPKAKYEIPEKDLEEYKKIIKDIPLPKMRKLVKLIEGFDKTIVKSKGKKYDVKSERTKSSLKHKEFIHKIGLWNEFIEYLQKNIDKIDNM